MLWFSPQTIFSVGILKICADYEEHTKLLHFTFHHKERVMMVIAFIYILHETNDINDDKATNEIYRCCWVRWVFPKVVGLRESI